VDSPSALRTTIASIATATCFLAASLIFFLAGLSGMVGFHDSTWSYEDMSLKGLFAWFVVVPIMLIVGGALPARILGAGLYRSLLSSGAVFGIYYGAILLLAIRDTSNSTVVSIFLAVFAFTPALVLLFSSVDVGDALAGKTLLLGTATFLAVPAFGLSSRGELFPAFLFGLFAWIALPIIAGLLQQHRAEEP
jgi:hypothetical protein